MSDRERSGTDAETVVDKPGDEITGATRREGSQRSRPRDEPEARLSRGTLVGRYVIVDVIGEGGMGVVYAAYDHELDRKVAIKLLQGAETTGSAGKSGAGGQLWLQREAQALGRLSHPNVVAVHDVGTLPGDRVWVAMELVDGVTLRGWLKHPRSWRDVRAVMLEAGAGLAAAHRAGLIHRDFKPENVLVGNDGRARVMDFGLARQTDQRAEDPKAARTSDLSIETRSPLSESLTIAGSVVGTPAYMAPEIFGGHDAAGAGAASPRSDQFAFGVTLYELLFLQRPYDKRAFAADAPRPKDLAPKEPPKNTVPARIQRIAMRAIAIDPAARFATMDDLLAELAIDPMARRRKVMAGVAAVGVVGAAVVATMKLTGGGAPAEDRSLLCKGADRHLAGIWDGDVKAAVERAFDATDKPFKHTAFTAIATTLDRYATEWTAAVTDSCEATQLRGEQTAEVQSLRQDCFDERLAVLRSFTGLLAKADDLLVEKASNGALALEREEAVSRCADIAALKAPNQPTEAIRPRVLEAKSKLADAHAGVLAGNYGRAINMSTEAGKLAKAIPFDPTYAEAELVRGMSIMQLGNQPDAIAALTTAAFAGLRGKRDEITVNAGLYLTFMLANQTDKRAEAKLWLDLSKAALVRIGSPPNLELLQLQTEGVLRATGGDLIGAAEAHTKALDKAKELYGKDNPQLAQSHQMLGATLGGSGNYAAARPHYEAALAMAIRWLGADHPDVALMHSGLASCYHYTGEPEKARAEFKLALDIRERVFGPNSPVLIPTLNNFAELLRDENDLEQALANAKRAKSLVDRMLGKNHPYYPTVTATTGQILVMLGRHDEARTMLDDAVAVGEKAKSPYFGTVLSERAKLARVENRWPEAEAMYAKAITALETAAGKQAVDLWKPLTGLALAKLHANKPAEARPLLERALAVAKGNVPESTLAETREALARTQP